jgi:hypothetical protein
MLLVSVVDIPKTLMWFMDNEMYVQAISVGKSARVWKEGYICRLFYILEWKNINLWQIDRKKTWIQHVINNKNRILAKSTFGPNNAACPHSTAFLCTCLKFPNIIGSNIFPPKSKESLLNKKQYL